MQDIQDKLYRMQKEKKEMEMKLNQSIHEFTVLCEYSTNNSILQVQQQHQQEKSQMNVSPILSFSKRKDVLKTPSNKTKGRKYTINAMPVLEEKTRIAHFHSPKGRMKTRAAHHGNKHEIENETEQMTSPGLSPLYAPDASIDSIPSLSLLENSCIDNDE